MAKKKVYLRLLGTTIDVVVTVVFDIVVVNDVIVVQVVVNWHCT